MANCGTCFFAEEGIAKENKGLVWCDNTESNNYKKWFDPEEEHICEEYEKGNNL